MNEPTIELSTSPAGLDLRLRAWRLAQVLTWLLGLWMLYALMSAPALGIHAFWNVLIPVAPALLVFAPGIWRNICPLGTTALLGRQLDLSRKWKMSGAWQSRCTLAGVLGFYAIVPMRHVVLDTSGPATALTLVILASLAVLAGLLFEWKSAWCSGLCPVHPVEKLYGSEPAATFDNAHCQSCERCVAVCPDSTPSVDPLTADKDPLRRMAGSLMVGGLVGFIWGWFHVQDYSGSQGWRHLDLAYGWPFAGLLASLGVYLVLERALADRYRRRLVRCFAGAAVACYYWYRLPALFGFGIIEGDGVLLDLRGVLPAWTPVALRVFTTSLFAWWLVARSSARRSWTLRPPRPASSP